MTNDLLLLPTCYATPSAGMHPSHTLPLKLDAIAEAGFKLVEIAFPDLEGYAKQLHPGYTELDRAGRGDLDALCHTAGEVKKLCAELGVEILAVHPFSEFEGYEDTDKREQSFARAHSWFKVLTALGCQMLQIGSSDDPSSSPNLDVIARDLRQLADEAMKQNPPIRLAYEMWAWGAHVNTWEHTWEVCKRVDRPNFGLCLDTFQICARTFADPISPNHLAPHAEFRLNSTLTDLTEVFSTPAARDKIFYFQISDGSRKVLPDDLQKKAQEQGISPLYAWSNSWRPLPFMNEIESGDGDFGGYLPVVDVVAAVLRTGYRGPISYEVFYEDDMAKDDPSVPLKWAMAAQKAHKKLIYELEKKGFIEDTVFLSPGLSDVISIMPF